MKILLVEDDELLAETLQIILEEQHYTVEVASDGEAAWQLIQAFTYDLMLLDVKLPQLDGISLCRRMRSQGVKIPILLTTGQDSSHDRIVGLDAGADDYLVKPFDPQELVARVRALLRRGDISVAPVLEWGDLRLDPSSCEVTYAQYPIHLTPKEYALLELFLRNPRRVFSCGAILDHLWSFDKIPGEEAVRTQIKGLRHKLKAAGAPDLIETVYGIGYRLKPRAAAHSLPDQRPHQSTSAVWSRFHDIISTQVAAIEQAVTDLLKETLRPEVRAIAESEAHKLAGSLGTFGLNACSQFAKEIEVIFRGSQSIPQETAIHLCQLVTALRQGIQNPLPSTLSTHYPDHRPLLLIIEGDRTVAGELATEAQHRQIRTIITSTLAAANEAIYHKNPNVVLGDISLAPLNEWSAIAELSKQTPPIPILIYTARDSLRDRLEVARLGGTAFLHKSMPPAQVLETVTQTLQRVDAAATKVMIVDDDPLILAALRSLLAPWGLKVTLLADPRQFWQTLASCLPDLLILDIEMPHINGIELCQVVRNDPRWSGLPIIFLTVHTDAATINRVFNSGADDFVSKPILGAELVTRIVNRLERIKLVRQLAEIDPLTGISNRQTAIVHFEKLLSLAKHQNQPLCFATLRLDNLQQINNYGYALGDAWLRRIGQLLRQSFRGEDIVSRWAGAEFAIAMYGMIKTEGEEKLRRIQKMLQQVAIATEQTTELTFLLGVAEYPQDGTNLQALYFSAAASYKQVTVPTKF